MSIVYRMSNRLQNNGIKTMDPSHLSLRHRHMAVLFEKGHTSTFSQGKNHKSCILRESRERKSENSSWRKVGQQKERMPDYSRRTGLYKQLPIKESDKHWKFKTMYSCSSDSQNRRLANV